MPTVVSLNIVRKGCKLHAVSEQALPVKDFGRRSPGLNVRNPATALVTLATALSVTVIFYAHTLFGIPAHTITPLITALVAGGLFLMAVFGALSMRLVTAAGTLRQASVIALYLSVLFCTVSTIAGAFARPMVAPDLGVFVVQAGTPVLVLLCFDRAGLLQAICRFAVLFAFADLAVNLLALFHIASVARVEGAGTSYGAHYLGLPGNSFAEGIVAFVGVSYLAAGVPFARTSQRFIRLGLIAALFGSEVLIRARTDIGISVVAVALLLFRNSHRIPAFAVAAFVSAALLFATFHAAPGNHEERLRSDMMVVGFAEAKTHVLLGVGSRYRDTQDLIANYRSLRDGGITESGTLDFAIAYGWFATICLYLSALLALAAPRLRQTLPAVLLVCLLGAIATTGDLGNFFGSTVFYVVLILCQREEWWTLQFTPRAI
jgi:hypothetical protein